MRDFRILRQREITRRFRRIVERRGAERFAFRIDVSELDLLWDLDPAAAARAS